MKPKRVVYHQHNHISCVGCAEQWQQGFKQGTPVGPSLERVVYKQHWIDGVRAWMFVLLMGGMWCFGYVVHVRSKDLAPYVVYRPDAETTAKLTDCQDSWREDQVTKRLLRMKVKRLEESPE